MLWLIDESDALIFQHSWLSNISAALAVELATANMAKKYHLPHICFVESSRALISAGSVTSPLL